MNQYLHNRQLFTLDEEAAKAIDDDLMLYKSKVLVSR